ncbi:hypothetical protein GCM10023196_010240 [Actinoallomurus vinaceus]|uniref:Uncharacterized protein n=1 Tax=Actinoallomurus vinaceus TaxID=1080074 RepID=A0ABP8U3U5_9ACTN
MSQQSTRRPRSVSVSRALWAVIVTWLGIPVLLVGLVFLVGGLMSVGHGPKCDGTPMKPGDVCTIRSGDSTMGGEVVSYDEMVKRHKSALPDALLMGLPSAGLAAVALLWALPALRADVRIPGRTRVTARPLIGPGQAPAVQRLMENFEQAGTLRLGELELSRDGASDPSGNLLPWSDDWELSGVRTGKKKEKHKVVIDAPGGRWLSAVVPNLPVAQALLKVLVQHHVGSPGSAGS